MRNSSASNHRNRRPEAIAFVHRVWNEKTVQKQPRPMTEEGQKTSQGVALGMSKKALCQIEIHPSRDGLQPTRASRQRPFATNVPENISS